jgi:hypothetical protein
MNKNINYSYTVMDDDGYIWYWDGSRIYALDVEDPDSYVDVSCIHRKGYAASTWKEALHLLVVDGYISEEEEEWQTRPSSGQEYKDWFDPKESYLPVY